MTAKLYVGPRDCANLARVVLVESRPTEALSDPWDLVRKWRRRASELERLSGASADARAELLGEMAEVYTECAEELVSALRGPRNRCGGVCELGRSEGGG